MDRIEFIKAVASVALLGAVKSHADSSSGGEKALIVYFSWSGNTRLIAGKIKNITGADMAELEPQKPYSREYNTCLDEALSDQKKQARPKLKNRFDNIGEYKTVLLGYPNWWGSIPMPVATFLQSYNFEGKKIIPFCSHGGGRFGQSISAISKLCPKSILGKPFETYRAGGSSIDRDVANWLKENKIS